MSVEFGSPRVVVYAVGRSGIGHAVRARRLAEHMVRGSSRAVKVTLVTAHHGASAMLGSSESVAITVLPELERLLSLSNQGAVPFSYVRWCADAILELLLEVGPDVLVSTSPSGLHGELRVALDRYQEKPRSVLALRDIYHPPRHSRTYDGLADRFNSVVVAAPPDLDRWTPSQVSQVIDQLGVRYLGYLAPIEWPGSPDYLGSPVVIRCHVGGGRDGAAVVRMVTEAFADLGATDAELHVDVGPYFDRGELAHLRAAGAPGVYLSSWSLPRSDHGAPAGVISMAGYNSCVESAWTGTPTLLCPRHDPEDLEQEIRAAHFQRLFDNISVYNSEPEALRSWLAERVGAAAVPTPTAAPENFYARPPAVAREMLKGSVGVARRSPFLGMDL